MEDNERLVQIAADIADGARTLFDELEPLFAVTSRSSRPSPSTSDPGEVALLTTPVCSVRFVVFPIRRSWSQTSASFVVRSSFSGGSNDLTPADIAAAWAAQDAAGRSLGALSGRAETREVVAGATIVVDYGTPAKRGRAIWGALVPWGRVWRTGANAATTPSAAPMRPGWWRTAS